MDYYIIHSSSSRRQNQPPKEVLLSPAETQKETEISTCSICN